MMIRAQNSYYLPPDGTHLITTLLNRIGSTHCFALPLPQGLGQDSKVIRVGSDTFGDPFIKSILQNYPSFPIIGD